MEVKDLLKKLKIKKEVNFDGNWYYFIGYENKMFDIEDKLEESDEVESIIREYFTNGYGRLCFRLKNK